MRCRVYHPYHPPVQGLLLWQSLALAWLCGLLAARWPLAALLCLGLLVWADVRLWRLPSIFAILTTFGLGLTLCLWLLPQRPALPPWIHESPRLSGTVDEVRSLPDDRLRVILSDVRPVEPPSKATDASLPSRLVWVWEAPSARPLEGQRVALSLRLRSTTGFRNPSIGDSGLLWATQGIFWRLWSRGEVGYPEISGTPHPGAATRQHLRQIFTHALYLDGSSTQGQAFLPALLFGEKGGLSSRTLERMAHASLVHSLALSGQHLALAGLLAAIAVGLLGRLWPQVYLRLPRSKLVLLISLAPAAFYLWMGGAPASLLRAFCMLALLALAVWKCHVASLMDVLLTAVLAITLVWPLGVFDTGLQLSVLCMAALTLALPVVRRIPLPARGVSLRNVRLLLRSLVQVLLISLCIQVALLPVSLLLFGFASPWFALNVLWLPMLGLWVLPLAALGLGLAVAGAVSAAHGVLWAASLPCDALLILLDTMAGYGLLTVSTLLRPHVSVLPAWAALITALALLPGRAVLPQGGKRLAAAGLLLLCVGPLLRLSAPWTEPLRLSVLDVGQGQAVVLSLPGGQRLLVDGGGTMSPRFDPGQAIVAQVLTANAAPRLHAVINSHPDSDHLRGLGYVLRTFAVDNFYHNGENLDEASPALLREAGGTPLHAGITVELPATGTPPLRLEVLHPPAQSSFTGNDNSLILRLVRGDRGLALLPGDAEQAALHHVLTSGRDVRAEVLVLPHHGSRSSLVPTFYDAVAPRLALVSCGVENRYNYPSPTVVQALEQRGIPLRSTGAEGCLEVVWPPGS